ELSVRSVNSLKKENIVTLGDLVQKTENEMLAIDNFGVKSLEEIRQFLNDHNLNFGMQLKQGEDGDLFLIERTPSADSDETASVGEGEEAAAGAVPEAVADEEQS